MTIPLHRHAQQVLTDLDTLTSAEYCRVRDSRPRRRRDADLRIAARRDTVGSMADSLSGLLPEGSLSGDVARVALVEAGATFGVDVEPAELIRVGSNAVFRLPGQLVGRVGTGSDAVSSGRRQVRASQWLAEQPLAAVRVVDGEQPVIAAGCVVTFWHSVSDTVRYGSLRDLAVLIRGLHALEPPSFDLPVLSLDHHLNERLAMLRLTVDATSYQRIEHRAAELLKLFAGMDFGGIGPIHGDANIGNVILDHDGTPVLMDLDNVAVGPRGWDLIKTAVYYDRFGWHTTEEYAGFCDIVGTDVTLWPEYSIAADLVEILMTLWLSRRADHDQAAADETRERVRTILQGAPRRAWRPY